MANIMRTNNTETEPHGNEPDPKNYWRRPADLNLPVQYWCDPEPEIRGMLAADRIEYYAKLVDMIKPFKPEGLKPASYDLTLGPMYQINGRLKTLETMETLVIPPNSIVFVATNEALRLPHYIAARFNLAITFIYQGLLLGTGPQVDPGFQGVLSCPLHNISSRPIRIKRDKHFATIDFTKTTNLASNPGAYEALRNVKTEEELYKSTDILGKTNKPHVFFKESKRWITPIVDYDAGRTKVSSSIAPLTKTVKKFQHFALLGAFAAALTLIGIVIALSYNVYGSYSFFRLLSEDRVQMNARLERLQQTTSALDQAVRDLTARAAILERNQATAANQPQPPLR